MKRLIGQALLLWIIPGGAAGQALPTQNFQVTPENVRATVGDAVTLRFRVRLDERDLLLDTVPRPTGPLPSGIQVLSVERLHRTPDRIFHGEARVAFYRPGRQAVPVFGLPFMRIVEGVRQATLMSDSSFVNVTSVLPAGNQQLKDIRELEPPTRQPWTLLAAGALLVAGWLLILRRRRRPKPSGAVPHQVNQRVPAPATDPYTLAMRALGSIEQRQLPLRGEIPRHYELVVDVLRDYLETAEAVPARERTTGEVVWALPPHLSADGLRENFRELLEEADSVKFARARPDLPAARRFLEQSRSLLTHWHAGRVSDYPANALR